MANKQKKKRNKKYTGAEAAITRPVITHVAAEDRSNIGQWWFEHKKLVRSVAFVTGVVLVVILTIVEIVRLASGH